MCGILGAIKFNPINFSVFEKQLNVIKYRGPDHCGYWFNENKTLGLGSRRLAIRDLSSNGNMPMISSDKNYVIVFNGEIYNHQSLRKSLMKNGFKFKSDTDTECVLYSYIQWGSGCLKRLEGMFAIAIYDKRQNILFLARDRAGEKPLYYCKNNSGFTFSSEIKQLFLDDDIQKKINRRALKQFLEDGFVKGKESFVENIFKLQGGSFLIYEIENSKISINNYWEIPPKKSSKKSLNEKLEKLDSLLSKAVENQMVSDVPLGILLSGGTDSSLVASYAADKVKKLKTFNISFNKHKKFDESDYARKVANYLDTDHIELDASNIDLNLIDELIEFYDEPLADSSTLPTYIVSKLTKQYVTVALGGDGGDELFGGYSHYLNFSKRINALEFSSKYLRKSIEKIATSLPLGFKGRNFLLNSLGDPYERFKTNRLFDKFSLKNILSDGYYQELHELNSKVEIDKTDDIIYDFTKHDFHNYLTDNILVKIDRASMASSLEMRSPFLDKSIIEFAFSEVNSELKVNNNRLKILPKELLNKRLPIDLNVDRKQGFSIPLNDWMSNEWFDYFINEINELEKIFNKEFVLKMCHNLRKGYTNSSRLFALIILNKWIKKYKILV